MNIFKLQALWYKKTDLVAKKLLDKCLNLVKDHSSLSDGKSSKSLYLLADFFSKNLCLVFPGDINEIIRQKHKSSKSKGHSFKGNQTEGSITDSMTYAQTGIEMRDSDALQNNGKNKSAADESALDMAVGVDESDGANN